MLGTLVDTDALWHVAAYALAGSFCFIAAFGLVVFARDRAATVGPTRGLIWNGLTLVGALGCLAVLAVGFWAMTQKPS